MSILGAHSEVVRPESRPHHDDAETPCQQRRRRRCRAGDQAGRARPWRLPRFGRGALVMAGRERAMPGPDRNAPDLQAIVDEIHAELSPRFGAGAARRLHPAARPRRPAPLRPRRGDPRRQRSTPRATPTRPSRSRASPRSSC